MPDASELENLAREYESGQLDAIKHDLAAFVDKHAPAIRRLRDDYFGTTDVPPTADEIAIKMYILKSRSINPSREILDQMEEINREKWIRGVHSGCAPDPQAVAQEWARLYSPGWRDHRVMSIIYVFEREKEKYLEKVRAAVVDSPVKSP